MEFGADGVSWIESGIRVILGDPATGKFVIVGDSFADAFFDPPAEISWRSRNQ